MSATATSVRVIIPSQLQMLAGLGREVTVDVAGPMTTADVLDALELRFPALQGTLRDSVTGERRPLIRFYAAGEDYSNASRDTPLPAAVAAGDEPLVIVGAIAGG